MTYDSRERERERERNGVENGDRQKVTRTATNDPLSNERGKKLKMKKKLENFNMMMHSTPLDNAKTIRSDLRIHA